MVERATLMGLATHVTALLAFREQTAKRHLVHPNHVKMAGHALLTDLLIHALARTDSPELTVKLLRVPPRLA